MAKCVLLPCSIGELFDKISILTLKQEYFRDVDSKKHTQVTQELTKLFEAAKTVDLLCLRDTEVFSRLHYVNKSLWKIEDELREYEKELNFETGFVEQARSVYFLNDQRAKIKAEINVSYGSDIHEVKSYV